MQSSTHRHTLGTVPIAITISICASTYTNLYQQYKCENKATLQGLKKKYLSIEFKLQQKKIQESCSIV